MVVFILYVEEIILIGGSDGVGLNSLKKKLANEIQIKDLSFEVFPRWNFRGE